MKHLPFFFLLCSLLCSCLSEEGYTSSADAQLRLERDTLALDTVLAGEPTNTYTFQVFNPHRKTLRIAAMRLALGAASPFSVNVDGSFLANGVGEATEVAGGDSLRVFVQLNAPASDAVSPTALEDRLVFRLESGVEQQVLLTASTQSVINLRAHRVESDITWSERRPYRILDSLVVAEGSTLTLSAGTRLYFHPEARLIVHGTLRAEGKSGAPVELRGDRLGYMFSNQPYDRIPGQWGGVVFSDKSHDNVLEFCEIHSGDFGIRCDSSSIDVQKLTLSNSLIHNVGGHGLYARQCALTVGNTQITNAAGDCVRLIGGRSEFTHCTIGQFYALAGDRGVALHFSNYGEGSRAPLERASFVNCIISGYNNDDLVGESSPRYKNDAFNYDFSHCLLNTPKPTKKEHFRNCLFEQDSPEKRRQAGNFNPSFDLQKLLFTFTLDAKSAAVGAADFAVTQRTFPFDRNGKSQTEGGKSDIGCYRHIKP